MLDGYLENDKGQCIMMQFVFDAFTPCSEESCIASQGACRPTSFSTSSLQILSANDFYFYFYYFTMLDSMPSVMYAV